MWQLHKMLASSSKHNVQKTLGDKMVYDQLIDYLNKEISSKYPNLVITDSSGVSETGYNKMCFISSTKINLEILNNQRFHSLAENVPYVRILETRDGSVNASMQRGYRARIYRSFYDEVPDVILASRADDVLKKIDQTTKLYNNDLAKVENFCKSIADRVPNSKYLIYRRKQIMWKVQIRSESNSPNPINIVFEYDFNRKDKTSAICFREVDFEEMFKLSSIYTIEKNGSDTS